MPLQVALYLKQNTFNIPVDIDLPYPSYWRYNQTKAAWTFTENIFKLSRFYNTVDAWKKSMKVIWLAFSS